MTDPARSLTARDARLVRPDRRRAVGGLAALAAVATAVLAGRYAGESTAGRTDRHLGNLLEQRGTARAVSEVVASVGGPAPTAVVLLVLAVIAWRVRGGRGLALVLMGPPTAMVTTSLALKPLVGRMRGDELAFPSGHTTSVTSLAVAAAVLFLGVPGVSRARRALVVVALAGVVASVAVSLVARDHHYATDTLGAVGVALAVVLAAALVVDAWADVVADPGPDPRVFDPRERPTDVLPRTVSSDQPRAAASSRASSSEAAAGFEPGSG
jgi:membrane-associated phospholipid phosphatase